MTTNTNVGDEGGTCKLSNSGGETGNIGSDDGVSITTWEGVSMPISREDAEDNALHQPTPSQGNTQGKRPGLAVTVAHV